MRSLPSRAACLITACVTFLVSVGTKAHCQCTYDVTATVSGTVECEFFGQAAVFGSGLNDSGDIVGDESCPLGRPQALAWFGDNPFEVPMPKGATESKALDINIDRCTVGYAVVPNSGFGQLAFVYDGTAGVPLGALPETNAYVARAINSRGDIVGWAGDLVQGPAPLAVAWECGTAIPTSLMPLLGTPKADARDINDDRQVVGWRGSSLTNDARAFLLDLTNAKLVDIGLAPGGTTGIAQAVNSFGVVAGVGSVPQGNGDHTKRSFIWSGGNSRDLGVLPGMDQCEALAINDRQAIVGSCSVGSTRVAFLWQEGRIRAINDLLVAGLNLDIDLATATNDRGQILAWTHVKASRVAVLLEPIALSIGDATGNCRVNAADLLLVLSNWGRCQGCPADLDMDGSVDFYDLLLVLANWG